MTKQRHRDDQRRRGRHQAVGDDAVGEGVARGAEDRERRHVRAEQRQQEHRRAERAAGQEVVLGVGAARGRGRRRCRCTARARDRRRRRRRESFAGRVVGSSRCGGPERASTSSARATSGGDDGVRRVVEEADRQEAEHQRTRLAPEPEVLVQHVEQRDERGGGERVHATYSLRVCESATYYHAAGPITLVGARIYCGSHDQDSGVRARRPPEQVDAARTALDAHVREIVAWHFDPATGCPFWLDFAQQARLGSAAEISGFDDLKRLGAVRGRVAARRPGAALGPEGARRASRSTCSRPAAPPASRRRASRCDDFRTDYELFSDDAAGRVLPEGRELADARAVGPAAPAPGGRAPRAVSGGGICFCVDLDPRWVIKLIKKGWMEHLQAYKDHVHRSGGDDPAGGPRHQLHVHHAEAARGAGAAARGDGHDDPARWASPASSPAAPSSRRSGTASRTRSCSTAPT